jgi:hypothetical protein
MDEPALLAKLANQRPPHNHLSRRYVKARPALICDGTGVQVLKFLKVFANDACGSSGVESLRDSEMAAIRSILLKNSVSEVGEKLSASQSNFNNVDMRSYQS